MLAAEIIKPLSVYVIEMTVTNISFHLPSSLSPPPPCPLPLSAHPNPGATNPKFTFGLFDREYKLSQKSYGKLSYSIWEIIAQIVMFHTPQGRGLDQV